MHQVIGLGQRCLYFWSYKMQSRWNQPQINPSCGESLRDTFSMRESRVTDATKEEERIFKRIKEFLQQPQVTPYEVKKKSQWSQLKSLGINETKINLFSFMNRGLLFFSPLLYFHVGVTPNNSFVLFLFVPDLGRRDSDPSTGLMFDSAFSIQREKQWIEFFMAKCGFQTAKIIYIYIYIPI